MVLGVATLLGMGGAAVYDEVTGPEVAAPAATASPSEVVSVYLEALSAHDRDLAHSLVEPAALQKGEFLAQMPHRGTEILAFSVDAAHPCTMCQRSFVPVDRDAVVMSVYATMTTDSNDVSIDGLFSTTFVLAQQGNNGPWRIIGNGNG